MLNCAALQANNVSEASIVFLSLIQRLTFIVTPSSPAGRRAATTSACISSYSVAATGAVHYNSNLRFTASLFQPIAGRLSPQGPWGKSEAAHLSGCQPVTSSKAMATSEPHGPQEGGDAAAIYEETHVHGVYEAIAPHFSATRFKPWPFVSSFLASQPPGSVGLDIGCGNGKNMGVNKDVVMLGCDRSAALIALARDMWCTRRGAPGAAPEAAQGAVIPGADVAVADGLQLPFRDASADFVICIAVIHHLSTRERRIDAIRQLLQCIRRNKAADGSSSLPDASTTTPGDVDPPISGSGRGRGGVLVYVWALEQSSSRRGWDERNEQDLLVPWVMKAPQQKKPPKKQPPKSRKKAQAAAAEHQEDATNRGDGSGTGEGRVLSGGEGGEDLQGRRQQSHGKQGAAGGGVGDDEEDVREQGGAAAAAEPEPSGKQSGGHTHAEDLGGKASSSDGQPQPHTDKDKTFHRFYHLYKKGELEEDVLAAGGQVLCSGYERDNWWVIAG